MEGMNHRWSFVPIPAATRKAAEKTYPGREDIRRDCFHVYVATSSQELDIVDVVFACKSEILYTMLD